MKTLFYLIIVSLSFSQSGLSGFQMDNWVKENSLSPFILGRGNTGIGAYQKNQINEKNTAFWYNLTRTFYGINITSKYNNITKRDNNGTLSSTKLGSLFWVSSVLDSTLSVGVYANNLYENSSRTTDAFKQTIPLKDSVETLEGFRSLDKIGNINQIKFGASYKPFTNLSFGLDAIIFYGNQLKTERTSFESALNGHKSLIEQNINYFGGSAGISMGYVSSNNTLSLGAYFYPQVTLSARGKTDLKLSGWQNNREQTITVDDFIVPQRIGFGTEYKTRMGSFFLDTELIGKTTYTNASNSFSVGYQSIPSRQVFESVFKRSTYSLGAYYHTENFKLNNNDVVNYGISAGMSIPFNFNLNQLSLGLSYGKRGSVSENGISENVFKFSIGLSVGEFWYIAPDED